MNTIVEAGHYYQVNGPSVLSMKGWEIGKELAASQPSAGLALLVDDYHEEQNFIEPGDTFLGQAEAVHAAQTLLTEADYVFSETEIAAGTPAKVVELLENGLVKLKKGVLSVGGVRLGYLRR